MKRVLGDFELEVRRPVSPVVRSVVAISLIRPASASCLAGDVRAHHLRRGGAEVGDPRRHLAARLVQRQAADVDDHAGVFGDGDEVRRRHQAAHGVTPAQQRLEPGDAAGSQRDDRLIVHLERVVVDGVAQVGLELSAARMRALAHRRIENLAGAPTTRSRG